MLLKLVLIADKKVIMLTYPQKLIPAKAANPPPIHHHPPHPPPLEPLKANLPILTPLPFVPPPPLKFSLPPRRPSLLAIEQSSDGLVGEDLE